jgi:twitching motility protein PilT
MTMSVEPHLDAWLSELHDRNGTDILLTHDTPPCLRVDGRLAPLEGAKPLTGAQIERITRTQMGDLHVDELRVGREVDFSFSWRDLARVRGNAFYQRGQCSLSLRRIPTRIPSPTELGIPGVMAGILHNPSGLILVTGPTGSGKSTTQASMVDAINRNRPCHIVTIEDPIEHVHTNKLAVISQRQVGTDTESFETALHAVVREDPDVVMVGEMRDLESISFALTIAETGHLVLATVHTNDSVQTIDRIIDVFPAERRPQIQIQLAGTLLAVIYQRLLPKVGAGMVAAYELMIGVPAVRNLIREGKTRQLRNVVTTHRADGMQTLEESLSAHVREGQIAYQTAVDASLYPQDIQTARPSMVPVAGSGRTSR